MGFASCPDDLFNTHKGAYHSLAQSPPELPSVLRVTSRLLPWLLRALCSPGLCPPHRSPSPLHRACLLGLNLPTSGHGHWPILLHLLWVSLKGPPSPPLPQLFSALICSFVFSRAENHSQKLPFSLLWFPVSPPDCGLPLRVSITFYCFLPRSKEVHLELLKQR